MPQQKSQFIFLVARLLLHFYSMGDAVSAFSQPGQFFPFGCKFGASAAAAPKQFPVNPILAPSSHLPHFFKKSFELFFVTLREGFAWATFFSSKPYFWQICFFTTRKNQGFSYTSVCVSFFVLPFFPFLR